MSQERFSGKVALITGASQGIGRGIALCLAEGGADVIVNYRSQRQKAEEVAAAITRMGRQALVVPADVSDRQAVAALFAAAVERFGHVDIAVANAAYSSRELVIEAQWENVLRTIQVSQFGVFHTCQMAAQQMVRQSPAHGDGGKIVIISSILEELAPPANAAYNMAKAAINHFG